MTTLAPRTTPAAWVDLDPVDRSWSGVEYVRCYLDLDVPAPADFREALRFLARAEPQIGRWQTASPPRWRPVGKDDLEDWLDRAVRTSSMTAPSPAEAFAVNAAALGAMPFRFVLGADWISLHITHAVADGATVDAFVGQVLRQAASPAPLRLPWTTVPPRSRDRAIARDVVRHARSLPGVVRQRRAFAGGEYEPAARRLDALQPLTLGLVSAGDAPRALRALRDELYPDASGATVAMVGLRAAFARFLPEPQPGFECLFNTRRAEPNAPLEWGNWSVGVYVRPSDDYSPQATAAEIARVRDAGVPAFATASMRARARRSSGDSVHVAAPAGAPRLTLSYMQWHALAHLPGARPGRSSIVTQTRPNGVETITVQAVEWAGRLALSIAFYPDAWPRADVERAGRLFLDDPRSCLERG